MSCSITKYIFIIVLLILNGVCFMSNAAHLEIKSENYRKSQQKLCKKNSDIKFCTELLDDTQNLDSVSQKSPKEFSKKEGTVNNCHHHKKCGLGNYSYMHWSAALLHQKSRSDPVLYKCGISLIHQRVALTAAHCLDDKKGFWSVKIGETTRKARRIILHPSFNATSLANDVSLIILNKPFSRKIGTVCIANKKYLFLGKHNKRCQSASWISDSNFDQPVSYLRIASVSVIARKKFNELLGFEAFTDEEHYNSICADQGDNSRTAAGNPLLCPIPGQPQRFYQVGVGSYGPQGCQNGSLGVYGNLPAYRQWIDRMMIKNGLDIDTYRY